MRHVGQVSIGSYEHISGMVMAGHMSIEGIRAFILKALMPLVFIRTFLLVLSLFLSLSQPTISLGSFFLPSLPRNIAPPLTD